MLLRRRLGAVGVCVAIAICTLYVTSTTAQNTEETQPKAGSEASPIYGVTIPAGYRDWHLIAVGRLTGGSLKQLRAQLGNDIAIKAFREGTRPFPDGAIIAALHWNESSSESNDKVLASGFPGAGLQSSLAGAAENVQFMVKDLEEVRRDGRLGICRLQERQAWRRGAAQDVLSMPCARTGPRFRLRALCADAVKAGMRERGDDCS